MAKVDIVVPCYNYGRFLENCIRSVLEQSIGDLRVLIIDDASSDDSLSVANKLAETDARVYVISHSENKGHIATYNEGIAWASADYFLLLSADDMLVPGALKRAATIMDQYPDIVLTHGNAVIWQDDLPFPKIDSDQNYTWRRQDLIHEMCVRNYNIVYAATAIGRTHIQKAIGGYRPSLPHSGDWEMWLRFAAHGGVAIIEAVQGIYRKHSCNMSDAYYHVALLHHQQRKQAFDAFFDEYGDCVPNSRSLRARADRVLSETAYWNGISELCRGYIGRGLQLLHFSIDLTPKVRYYPPIGYLLSLAVSQFRRSVSILLRMTATRIGLWNGSPKKRATSLQ